jgi:hypothetical protein
MSQPPFDGLVKRLDHLFSVQQAGGDPMVKLILAFEGC